MSQHFLLSPAVRKINVNTVAKMSEQEMFDMFAEARWNSTTQQICPACGTVDNHYWKGTRKQWVCKSSGCSRTFSLLSGTKLESSKLPLRTLLQFMLDWVSNAKGISAIEMSRRQGMKHIHAYMLMQKFREAIMVTWDYSPLSGVVHVDGSHLGGRLRKGNNMMPGATGQRRDRTNPRDFAQHPNRRIVMIARSVTPGTGATRTITGMVRSETAELVIPFVRKYLARGSVMHTDELGAYGVLGAHYDHRTVNHSREFQTEDGVDTNQAESYFTRVKRFYMGTVHRLTPKYMADYMAEISFREDYRRKSNGEKLQILMRAVMSSGRSEFWRRYKQNHHRSEEIMFPATIEDALRKAHAEGIALVARQKLEREQDEARRRAGLPRLPRRVAHGPRPPPPGRADFQRPTRG